MIKFRINQSEWMTGHTGHLQLKENSFDLLATLERDGLEITVAGTDTPLKDEALVSMTATVIKSHRHLNFLTGSQRYSAQAGSPWKTYQNTANMERVAATLPEWIKLDLEQKSFTLKLWDPCSKSKAVVLATLRRVTNLLEWAERIELRLTSSKNLKWGTFNGISTTQTYNKA